MEVKEILKGRSGKRDIAYAACGMLLGVMAPVGWIILRLMLFWDDSQSRSLTRFCRISWERSRVGTCTPTCVAAP